MKELEHLVDLTERVQQLVESGDWGEAARLDMDRRPLIAEFIDRFIARHPGQQARQQAAETVRKVIAMDRETMQTLGERRSSALADASRSFSAGRAIQAYLAQPDMERPLP
ncbi:MAG: flagellar protein FliT [Gammaproteobacteria bacterium]